MPEEIDTASRGKRLRIAAAICFLVRVVHVRVQQAHRHRLDAEPADLVHQPVELGLGERRDHVAVARRAARRLSTRFVVGHERLRDLEIEVVELVAASRAPMVEHVARALGDDERRSARLCARSAYW